MASFLHGLRTALRQPFQVAAAGAAGFLASPAARMEDRQSAYVPPPRLGRSFEELPKSPPEEPALRLAWAVKNLEVEVVRDGLEAWPQGAALLDAQDNTLFHLAALESGRYAARPEAAEEVMALLLQQQDGWTVVDQKNKAGERADFVASKLLPGGPAARLLCRRSQDYLEPSLAEKPLQLIGQMSPLSWQWHYPLQDDRRRCWAGLLQGAIPKETLQSWMKRAREETPWITTDGVDRKVAWFVTEDHVDCPYKYSGLEYPAVVFPPFMEEIRQEVSRLCGLPPDDLPNSCNVNVYEHQGHDVPWHSDDEVLFQGITEDTRIISLTLGATRDFAWRLQGTTQAVGVAPLGDGDIMTMEGLFQKHYKHCVPRVEEERGPRINFTFRWIRVKADAPDADTKSVCEEHTL